MKQNLKTKGQKKRMSNFKKSKHSSNSKQSPFQQFLDALPFGVYIVDKKYDIAYVNSQLRKEFGDPDSQRCHEYFHGLENPCPWCKNEKVFDGEMVIWNWHSEKTGRDYELYDLPLKNDDGSISKIEIFIDATERLRLESERERFRLAVEQSADSIIMTDLSGIITYANTASETVYGYPSGELKGRHVGCLNSGEDLSDALIIPKIIAEGIWHGELIQKKKDASTFHALLSCTAVHEDGKPVAMLAIIRDITELKRKEKDLIKSETLLRETQALTQTGGWELDVETGRVNWTDEVYRIYGVDAEAYDPNEIDRDIGFYAPAARPILKKAFQRAMEQGEPYDLELEFIRANQQRIWVRTMGRPEKKDGKVVRISGNFIDITASRQLVQEREQALNLLQKVYESLKEAVFVVAPQNRQIISCNLAAERIFGYSKDEMIGRNTEFLHVDKKGYQAFGKKLTQALASGTEPTIEFSLKRKDGTLFPTEHTVKVVRDDTGSPIIHVSVVRDLTFRKMAEQKLLDQQKELEKRAQRLEELNATLKVLLDQREKEKKSLEKRLSESIGVLILPYLKKLKKTRLSELQNALVDLLETNVKEMVSPLQQSLSSNLQNLTPTETTVADLIKLGYRTKEIAAKLNISTRTVEFHRDNIRKKLSIKGRKLNLETYLSRTF